MLPVACKGSASFRPRRTSLNSVTVASKNYAKGFSDAQIKVREATSNDPWGPSGTLMNEIAQLTYNEYV